MCRRSLALAIAISGIVELALQGCGGKSRDDQVDRVRDDTDSARGVSADDSETDQAEFADAGNAVPGASDVDSAEAGVDGSGPAREDAPTPSKDGESRFGDCEEITRSGTEQSCNLDLSCELDDVGTSCSLEPDGTWSCLCVTSGSVQSYSVTPGPGEDACGAASRVCRSASAAAAERTTCTPVRQSQGSLSCELEQQCSESQTLDGASVSSQGNTLVSCAYQDAENADTLGCHCVGLGVARPEKNYLITEIGTEESCHLALDLCNTQESVFDGEMNCEPDEIREDEAFCSLSLGCTQSSSAFENVTRMTWDATECETLENGSSKCTCFEPEFNLEIGLPGESDSTQCREAIDVCARLGEIEVSDGTQDCQPVSQNVPSAQTCDGHSSCALNAKLEGRDLIAYGELYFDCTSAGDDAGWSCTCSTALNDGRSFEIEATVDAWSACQTASIECPKLLAAPVIVGSLDGTPIAAPVRAED